jgi:hypothetical protein
MSHKQTQHGALYQVKGNKKKRKRNEIHWKIISTNRISDRCVRERERERTTFVVTRVGFTTSFMALNIYTVRTLSCTASVAHAHAHKQGA